MDKPISERADIGAVEVAGPKRGVDPLSAAHRRRLLRALNAAAADGDVSAQAALVELSLSAERDAKIAAALERFKADEGENA